MRILMMTWMCSECRSYGKVMAGRVCSCNRACREALVLLPPSLHTGVITTSYCETVRDSRLSGSNPRQLLCACVKLPLQPAPKGKQSSHTTSHFLTLIGSNYDA